MGVDSRVKMRESVVKLAYLLALPFVMQNMASYTTACTRINIDCGNADNALREAAEYGNLDKLEASLKCPRVNINHIHHTTFDRDETALALAVRAGQVDAVKLLLNHEDIDINAGDPTPLYAATDGHFNQHRYEITRLLLSNSQIDVNKGTRFEHPLYIPAHNGDSEMVRLLIKHPQTDVNSRNYKGYSALMIANERHMAEVVDILLRCPRTEYNINGTRHLNIVLRNGRYIVVPPLTDEKGPTCTCTPSQPCRH